MILNELLKLIAHIIEVINIIRVWLFISNQHIVFLKLIFINIYFNKINKIKLRDTHKKFNVITYIKNIIFLFKLLKIIKYKKFQI